MTKLTNNNNWLNISGEHNNKNWLNISEEHMTGNNKNWLNISEGHFKDAEEQVLAKAEELVKQRLKEFKESPDGVYISKQKVKEAINKLQFDEHGCKGVWADELMEELEL